MKSKVIKHGTRFLLRIIYEGLRGVKPIPGKNAYRTCRGDYIRQHTRAFTGKQTNDPV
jgi:hypothetical protein